MIPGRSVRLCHGADYWGFTVEVVLRTGPTQYETLEAIEGFFFMSTAEACMARLVDTDLSTGAIERVRQTVRPTLEEGKDIQ